MSDLAPIFKAFLTDIFMIYVPALYVTTYGILGSANAFRQNQGAIFIVILFYGIVTSLFFTFSGQTPGYRYAKLELIFRDKKPGFFRVILRFFIFILSMGFVFGLFFPFFDKQSRTFHDVLCKTRIKHRD